MPIACSPQPTLHPVRPGNPCPELARHSRRHHRARLEWKPSDAVHSVLDLYYSRFKQHTITRGAEWFSDAWVDDVTYSNIKTETRDGNSFDVADHVTNVAPVLRWDDNKRTDHLFSAGLNNDFRLAEHTHLLADLSYSSNKRDETDIEIFGGYGPRPVPDANAVRQLRSRDPRQRFPAIHEFRPRLCRCEPSFARRPRGLGRLRVRRAS